jgi:hypothetical protein
LQHRVDPDAAHVIMGDRCHFDRPAAEVDAVGGEPIHHRTEGVSYLGRRHVLETEIGAAGRTATAGFDFLGDGIGREIAGQHVAAVTATVLIHIVRLELMHVGIEQLAA